MKKYPTFGVEMLSTFEALAEVRDIVGAHQERWDGSGYPSGLAGDDIPIGAQIVGLCDVYTVLTSERSYRPALAPDTARRTIESGAERLWNPDLVHKLLDEAVWPALPYGRRCGGFAPAARQTTLRATRRPQTVAARVPAPPSTRPPCVLSN